MEILFLTGNKEQGKGWHLALKERGKKLFKLLPLLLKNQLYVFRKVHLQNKMTKLEVGFRQSENLALNPFKLMVKK